MSYFYYGAQSHANQTLYALYLPVVDRFVLTGTNLLQIEMISLLLSSRYLTWICEISSAENWVPGLVDNECCHNWTLENRKDVLASQLTDFLPVKVTKLIEHTQPWPAAESEKSWTQTLIHWTGYLFFLQTQVLRFYKVNRFVDRILGQPSFEQNSIYSKTQQLETDVARILYLGHDPAETNEKILLLIKPNQIWQDSYESYLVIR